MYMIVLFCTCVLGVCMYSLVHLNLCLFVIYVVLCISVFKCVYVLFSNGVSFFVCTLVHLCLSVHMYSTLSMS